MPGGCAGVGRLAGAGPGWLCGEVGLLARGGFRVLVLAGCEALVGVRVVPGHPVSGLPGRAPVRVLLGRPVKGWLSG